MSRIAVLFAENLYDRKGSANATLNRIKHLSVFKGYEISVFCITSYEYWLIRILRHTKRVDKIDSLNIEGLKINIIWSTFSLFDYLLRIKLHGKAIFRHRFVKKISARFKSYDLISAHSDFAGEIAKFVFDKYGVPYCVTWHGSDIHTNPFKNKFDFRLVSDVMESACYNFFVSKALLDCSELITKRANKKVLYNGASEVFYNYGIEKKTELRNKFGISPNSKLVAFVGNLISIKNADMLPSIFLKISESYNKEHLYFWIIGDGKLREHIELEMKKLDGVDCVFWGNQPIELMPLYMNCIDVLILPSKNEGLPLVTVEALKCGANVVGSNVGGIKEVIGVDNVFDLDENFIENIARRVVFILEHGGLNQAISSNFDWDRTAELENKYYKEILSASASDRKKSN